MILRFQQLIQLSALVSWNYIALFTWNKDIKHSEHPFRTQWVKLTFSPPQQEIDGKSLLLMQRSDVLTGLSIRLGPALKIYERHVKVLQRTHFLEYEDLWRVGSRDRQTMLHWHNTCMQCPLPSGPTFIYRICRGWVVGKAAVELTFTVRMTRNWKSVILPLITVFGFQMVFISPMWPFNSIVKGLYPYCSECV